MNIELLRRLCETPGIPGREERVRTVIESEVKDFFDEVHTDPMGSLICTRKATAKSSKSGKPTRVMIAAHMDEIGFYVRHIDEKGFLWINPAGGFDTRNLFSRRVLVCTEHGDFEGVMNPGGKPIHIASAEDRKKVPEIEEFFVDLGMTPEMVSKKVQVGDFIVLHEPFMEQPAKLVSKALDNRFACYTAIEAMRTIAGARAGNPKKKKAAPVPHAAEIIVAFTVQEEVGLRGATTSANRVGADIGIGLDVTLAVDTPGVPDTLRVARHGEGAALMLQDSSMIADMSLVRELITVAERHSIPYQRCILGRGGQDGAAIQRSGAGARCATITCGTRYIHTVTESIDRTDLQACVDLLAAWLPTVK